MNRRSTSPIRLSRPTIRADARCSPRATTRSVFRSHARSRNSTRAYDEIRLSIARTIEELDPRAASLIGKNAHNIDVALGGKANYSVSAFRLDLSPKGLNLDPPRDAFAANEEVERVLAEIDTALQRADRAAGAFCRDAQFLIARLPNSK